MQTVTYPDYVFFCKAFQEWNLFDFEESDIKQEPGETPSYTYDATFRDESNYKTNVVISFDGAAITWAIADGWEDAHEEINTLYDSMMQLKASGRQLVL
ncbi:hypothetical protein EHV15_33760 [Paenibacillus oralis]|uniref:Uncharacterized protein n=1 Tax=Paenibacillus oralis TaxID=2490856 RepID=A0A3P3T9A3_9BACL|nr:hypothetical protein [Paenibacillus oralis]RRJ54580.1 hypothetical protein EHV15_33760 [Paenibacillus oralis]